MSDTAYPKFDGRARRVIDIRTHNDSKVVAWLEDDFHCFGVVLHHDGQRVSDIHLSSNRYPFTTCSGAELPLKSLVGAPLEVRASAVGKWIDMRMQCTHAFDLAGLCLAQAAKNRADRRYESVIEDRKIIETLENGSRILGSGGAKLYMNKKVVLAWELHRNRIISPGSWKEQSLGKGFRERTDNLEVELAEFATVLRRAVMVAGGRSGNRAAKVNPRDTSKPAVCHSYREPQRAIARSIPESLRNWQESSEGMLLNLVNEEKL